MAYVALYRRWRPQGFDALVGQDAVRIALSNALTTGRIAHAYLFAGPRGTGKTSTAKILAKALNCEQGPTASGSMTAAVWMCLRSTLPLTAVSMRSVTCVKKSCLRLSTGVIKYILSMKCIC